ncbi:hypothetical protein QPK87_15750 [Kamptonema cortianum]|nr:hypothetical protein [Kamptonema cortianum]
MGRTGVQPSNAWGWANTLFENFAWPEFFIGKVGCSVDDSPIMSGFDHRGYVAIFSHPLTPAVIGDITALWRDRFERLEQVIPDVQEGATKTIESDEDLVPDTNYSFRICNGEEFAWAYLTVDRYAIETSSFPGEGEQPAMCLSVLVELPGLREIVDEHDDKRLDELEALGLL